MTYISWSSDFALYLLDYYVPHHREGHIVFSADPFLDGFWPNLHKFIIGWGENAD